MSIRSDLRTYLQTQATVTAVVGTRIFPVVLPQGYRPTVDAEPAITYQASNEHDHLVKGSAGNSVITFDLVCWGQYDAADSLAEILRQVMQGFSGTMGSTKVYAVILAAESDGYELPTDGSDNGDYTITLSYRIRYEESVPAL